MKKSLYATMEDYPKHIQKILYKLCEIGKSQAWLAREVYTSPKYLNDMIKGRRALSFPVAYRVALKLGFDPQEFIQEIKDASK